MAKSKSSNRNLNSRLKKLESVTRPEVKFQQGDSYDLTTAPNGFATVGSVTGTLLTPQALQEGVGRNQRVGDKVKSRNIKFQAIFKMPQNPASPTCAIRVLVLRSKFTEPDTSDMPNWYAPVDEDKFFVVKDIMTQVSAVQARTVTGTSFETGSTLKRIQINIPIGLRKLQYDGASNMSPINNEYVIYMYAENQSAEVAYNWQHYYIDN